MTRSQLLSRTRTAAGALALLLALTGCTDDDGGTVDQRQQQDAELRQRPTLEQEQARLTTVRDEVRDRLAADLGLTAWSDRDNANGAGCGELDQSSGKTAFLSTLLLTGGVPDARWQAAADLVAAVAAAHGFGAVDVVVDRPGEHEIVLRGEHGSLLRFGTLQNATLALATGCHLPAAVHGNVS